MVSPEQIVRLIKVKYKQDIVRFATVDPNYSGSGRPSLIFDGETSPTVKQYPYTSSYTPTAGDRVLVLKNVVIDKII